MGENLHDALENESSQRNVLLFLWSRVPGLWSQGPGASVTLACFRALGCSLATNMCPDTEKTCKDKWCEALSSLF